MRSSIQVSDKLRRRLAKLKDHPAQSYEEIIERALDSALAPPSTPAPELPKAIRDALAELRPILARLYGDRIVRTLLYGSAARGEARPDSDVDILVILKGDVQTSREIDRLVDATYDIVLHRGVQLSVLPMAEADYLTRATPLLMNVRREGVPL